MPRLTGVSRALAALCSIWFVLFGLLPEHLRPCPMHAAEHAATAPMDRAGHPHHTPTAPAPEAHQGCDCLGTCSAAPVLATAPTPIVARVSASVPLLPSTPAPIPTYTRAWLLPLANGPPALTSG